MISKLNLFKILVTDIPKCVMCVNYKPGVLNSPGICKIYGDLLSARTHPEKCTIEAKTFVSIKQKFLPK